jgi:tRNA threonylcarbamoyladenosine biosynthesis protein TsaB
MLILGLDSSGKNGSIALADCRAEGSRTVELVPLEGGTFSAQLVPQISGLLAAHKFTTAGIDGFAVVSGPGSFTGLRVGLAVIKALAEILQKPIAAVSLLEALAMEARVEGRAFAALDAGRNEVYCGEYRLSAASHSRLILEQLLSQSDFHVVAAEGPVVTSDVKIAEAAQARGLSTILVELPRADIIARLGFAKIQAGNIISPDALDANYIRRTDAEVRKPASL